MPRSLARTLSVDIQYFTSRGVDIDLHITASRIASLDLPRVSGKLGVRHRHQSESFGGHSGLKSDIA